MPCVDLYYEHHQNMGLCILMCCASFKIELSQKKKSLHIVCCQNNFHTMTHHTPLIILMRNGEEVVFVFTKGKNKQQVEEKIEEKSTQKNCRQFVDN